jgi:hypothetical protein
MTFRKRATLTATVVVVLFVLATGALYWYIVTGGLIARQKPPAIEKNVTRLMLDVSVPESADGR